MTPLGRATGWSRIAPLVAALSLLLTACGTLVDPGESRLCRALLAGLNRGAAGLRIMDTRSVHPPDGPDGVATTGVSIDFEVAEIAGQWRRGRIGCHFVASRPGPVAGHHLQGAIVDGRPLGPSRVYFARRFWLDTAEGAAADPEPIIGQGQAVEIARPVAIALQCLLAGLPKIGIYVLLALACALVQGLAGRANLAFGDIAALGGYGAALGVAIAGGAAAPIAAIGLGLGLAVWTAGWLGGLAGRHIFWPLSGRSGQAALIASLALGLSLAEFVRLAHGPGGRPSPPLLDGPVAVARAGDFIVTTTLIGVAAAVVAGAVALGVLAFMRRTSFGRSWRAAADDPVAAAMMGIDGRALNFNTFMLAGILAGVAGALLTLATGGAGQGIGLLLGIKGVIAAILGGAGSLGGAAVVAAAIGLGEALWPIALPLEHMDAGLFAMLIAVLILRPGGLFGTPSLEARR